MNDIGMFSTRLKAFRTSRRLSQMALALQADISQRHLSYLEIGRSKPSRSMVLRLATCLGAGMRATNTLLLDAGFAPAYPETPLTAPPLSRVAAAIERLLASHDPNPAVMIDGTWTVRSGNRAAARLLAALAPTYLDEPVNLMRLVFDPHALRPLVANFEALAPCLLARLAAEADAGSPAEALLGELRALPGVQQLEPTVGTGHDPLLTLRLRLPMGECAFFSTITTLGTPFDITLRDIRIETFFPADAATAAVIDGLPQGRSWPPIIARAGT